MTFIDTYLVTVASADLEKLIQEELLIPDPETAKAMEIFTVHEDTTEHDGRGNNSHDEEGGESRVV